MNNPNCEAFEPLISAMLDGELSHAEQLELEAHLDDCVGCRRQVSSFENVDLALQTMSAAPGSSQHANTSVEIKSKPYGLFSVWRLIPLAVAASLLICLGIAIWPNSQPASAEQISPEQFVKPMTDLHFLNLEKHNDQILMLKTLSMDLRSLKLEINQLEPGSIERKRIAKQIDMMIQKVQLLNAAEPASE